MTSPIGSSKDKEIRPTNVKQSVKTHDGKSPFFRWEGVVKTSTGNVVKEIATARKRRGRV